MAKMILMMSLERSSVYCVCADCCTAVCEHGRALPKRGTDGLPSGERHDVGCTVVVVVMCCGRRGVGVVVREISGDGGYLCGWMCVL